MNREQMIERALCAIWSGCEGSRVQAEIEARNVVDAILPQVTTVEELEALLIGSVLVDAVGMPIQITPLPIGNPEVRGYRGGGITTRDAEVMLEDRPLTVVWQP